MLIRGSTYLKGPFSNSFDSLQEAVMFSRGAQQALVPGRLVTTLNQRSGLPELGVVCGTALARAVATAGAGSGFAARRLECFGAQWHCIYRSAEHDLNCSRQALYTLDATCTACQLLWIAEVCKRSCTMLLHGVLQHSIVECCC